MVKSANIPTHTCLQYIRMHYTYYTHMKRQNKIEKKKNKTNGTWIFDEIEVKKECVKNKNKSKTIQK